jgi:tRNA pseudouridine38-40 synthase
MELAYDGTHFGGWQTQPNAPTVQAHIDQALSQICNTPIETMGCGRTDAGVHAKYFVAHFDGPSNIPVDLAHRLNKLLPPSIAIQTIAACPDQFHARFDAILREYQYFICTKKDPFLAHRTWFMGQPLDVESMNLCATKLIGKHSFAAFCKGDIPNNNPVCEVFQAHWSISPQGYVFTIQANRFLRNMVRAIVGTLVDVGQGKITHSQFEEIVHHGNRSNASHSAPADGLFLTNVVYPEISNSSH